MLLVRMILAGLCGCLCCTQSEKEHDAELARYSALLNSVNDSTQVIQTDSVKANPILASIREGSPGIGENEAVGRNPFSPARAEVRVEKVRVEAPRPVSEIRGLKLTGIIHADGRKKALVNGLLYEEGDRIGALVISSIRTGEITLTGKTDVYTLHLKEN
ncbi:MAG: hypothetical protein ACOY90_04005 [Candidatus Zhuqueibacterota bacterium]